MSLYRVIPRGAKRIFTWNRSKVTTHKNDTVQKILNACSGNYLIDEAAVSGDFHAEERTLRAFFIARAKLLRIDITRQN
jgi:hypothetical protein